MKVKKHLTLILGLALLASCSEDSVSTRELENAKNQQEENLLENSADFRSLLEGVETINLDYAEYSTRDGDIEDISKSAAKGFLSCVADGCVGAVAAPATCGLGGYVIGSAASIAYGCYLDYILGEIEKPIEEEKDDTDSDPKSEETGASRCSMLSAKGNVPYVILGDGTNKNFIDSIGYYHNVLISKMKQENKNYINDKGEINYDSLMSDLLSNVSAVRPHTEIPDIKINKTTYRKIDKYIHYIINSDNSLILESPVLYYDDDSRDKTMVKMFCSKITRIIPYISDEKAIEYAKRIEKIIDKSNIDKSHKDYFKIGVCIMVNSKIYWRSVYEKY